MLLATPLSKLRLLLYSLLISLSLIGSVSAMTDRVIEASSLYTCMSNSKLSADRFNVAFTPINSTITYTVNITAEISGYVQAYVDVYAYGFKIISEHVDPCSLDAGGLCPVYPGSNYLSSTYHISSSVVSEIPGIAYTFPDIDAIVVVKVKDDTNTVIACIEAELSNRKSVNHIAVKWVTAIIAGIGMLTSAIISTMGSTYTAAHIAANSVSLFAYFQSVVIISMLAVERMPPIASSWAQNLAWSVGLIRVTFMQKIFRWYVAATGGTPTQYISYPTISILTQKRDQIMTQLTNHTRDLLHYLASQLEENPYTSGLYKRASSSVGLDKAPEDTDTLLVLRGIKRVAYEANIEETSAVLTSFTFFVLICIAVCICFGLAYLLVITFFSKDKFPYFRSNWTLMLKGTILRLLFIAFPSLLVFSLWEFIQRDSAAVIVLAVFFLTLSIGILGWSATKVLLTGKQSIRDHETPAYLLFSDTSVLNRYGFLYVPYKAFSYYYIIPILGYFFVKSCFVSFAQSSGRTQALAFFIIEIFYFISNCYYRPYMDKSTNVINIIIGVIMLINSFLFLFFSHLFGQPRSVDSVMGIIFFIMNAAFSLILLLYTLITCSIVLLSKNPDARYKPAADDRANFIKDQKAAASGDIAELTALGAAARADHEPTYMESGSEYNRPFDDEYSNYDQEQKRQNPGPVTNVFGDDDNSSYSNPFSEKPKASVNGVTSNSFEVDNSYASLSNSFQNNGNSVPPSVRDSGTSFAPAYPLLSSVNGAVQRPSSASNNLSGNPFASTPESTRNDGGYSPHNSNPFATNIPISHTITNTSSINNVPAATGLNTSNPLRSSSSQSHLTNETDLGAGSPSSISNDKPSKRNVWKKIF
ncbi:uncharacterized protein SAPINGB_P005951 [Magnusiomyces paraingens]|uniref:ML-like domain-containing protein n=1 Tax=Magnusiomyces paraingens TaxID=2606893 RepID=A0A5E8C7P3_9ASCO|nr:uncharacterized protein SAPINGB_P005951 [Saprochaete ingens]VVT57928.1 unnamed protein product [Saprochaete ingens]